MVDIIKSMSACDDSCRIEGCGSRLRDDRQRFDCVFLGRIGDVGVVACHDTIPVSDDGSHDIQRDACIDAERNEGVAEAVQAVAIGTERPMFRQFISCDRQAGRAVDDLADICLNAVRIV